MYINMLCAAGNLYPFLPKTLSI